MSKAEQALAAAEDDYQLAEAESIAAYDEWVEATAESVGQFLREQGRSTAEEQPDVTLRIGERLAELKAQLEEVAGTAAAAIRDKLGNVSVSTKVLTPDQLDERWQGLEREIALPFERLMRQFGYVNRGDKNATNPLPDRERWRFYRSHQTARTGGLPQASRSRHRTASQALSDARWKVSAAKREVDKGKARNLWDEA